MLAGLVATHPWTRHHQPARATPASAPPVTEDLPQVIVLPETRPEVIELTDPPDPGPEVSAKADAQSAAIPAWLRGYMDGGAPEPE